MTEPTPKEWKRRALKAEETVKLLQRIRASEAAVELKMVHELAAARVALREIEDALNQSKMIADSACNVSARGQFE